RRGLEAAARDALLTSLDCVEPGFAGADANGLLDIGHENLAIADAPGLSGAPDRVDRALDKVIADHDLDLHLRHNIPDVLGPTIELGMALLPAKALGFGHGNALKSDLLKRFFHLVQFEWLDDGFDFFH